MSEINLSTRDYNILQMKWVDNASNPEIVEKLNTSKSTIQRTITKYKNQKDEILAIFEGKFNTETKSEKAKKQAEEYNVKTTLKDIPAKEEKEVVNDFTALKEKLNGRDYALAEAYFVKKMTVNEIVAEIGTSKSTVRRAIKKAKDAGFEDVKPTATKKAAPAKKAESKSPAKKADDKVAPMDFLLTNDSVIIVRNGETFTYPSDHMHYNDLKALVEKGDDCDWNAVNEIVDYKEVYKKMTYGFFNITDGGTVTYAGKAVCPLMAKKMLELNKRGIKPTALMKFYDNLSESPSDVSIESALRFVIENTLPIDPEGNVIAYKIVRADYKDVHSGKFDNSPGQMVAMPRGEVDHNPNQTCSSGLHACSKGYLGHFGGSNSKLVAVKINPRDICSVPHDYKNSKMRCMRYEVIADITGKTIPDNYIDSESCDWYK